MKFCELELVRLLGKGGMSEVWEAVNPRLDSRCAVKIYAFEGDREDVTQRFEQEGRLLAKLHHPRIVGVHDIGQTEDGRPYFVMDLVLNPEGIPQTLAGAFDKGVDEEAVARWYEDIREGLSYIHACGVVHRDLKLENIMVGPDGHVVLTDFGISRVCKGKDGRPATIVDPVKTVVSVCNGAKPLMGSLGYMAPELEMGCEATAQSDWYALGVIIFRLLTGMWCDARTDISSTLDTFDPAWAKIIPRLLHSNPAGRECLSYKEVKESLQQAEAVALESRLDSETAQRRSARRLLYWTVGLAVLLAGGLLVETFELHSIRRRGRLLQAQGQVVVPSFDQLFAIPAAARADEILDESGDVTMPSRNQFSAARVDALVLTHPILSALASGSITPEKAVANIEALAEALSEDSAHSPFDGLEYGGQAYMQMGDDVTLKHLLLRAAEKLRVRSEME